MSIQDVLRQLATDHAQRAQEKSCSLQRALLEIEELKRKLEEKLDMARLARNRLASFRLEIAGEFQCPECWIESGRKSRVISDRDDMFRCDTDEHDFAATLQT
jgi:hypothetical protein